MIYLSACLLCIVGVECFIRLPVMQQVKALGEVSRKSSRVISSRKISDHWKEKALQRYSRDMALASLSIGFFLIVLALLVGILANVLDYLLALDPGCLVYLASFEGIALALVFSTVYVILRQRFVKT